VYYSISDVQRLGQCIPLTCKFSIVFCSIFHLLCLCFISHLLCFVLIFSTCCVLFYFPLAVFCFIFHLLLLVLVLVLVLCKFSTWDDDIKYIMIQMTIDTSFLILYIQADPPL
jgi:hypothetical protein